MKSTVKMATSVTFILYAVCFLLVQQVSNTNAAPTNNKVEDETLVRTIQMLPLKFQQVWRNFLSNFLTFIIIYSFYTVSS